MSEVPALVAAYFTGFFTAASLVVALFFLRFWVKSRDRLFLIFGIAFWILALGRVLLLMVGDPNREDHSFIYLIRLVAFGLILFAIVDKNRTDRGSNGP